MTTAWVLIELPRTSHFGLDRYSIIEDGRQRGKPKRYNDTSAKVAGRYCILRRSYNTVIEKENIFWRYLINLEFRTRVPFLPIMMEKATSPEGETIMGILQQIKDDVKECKEWKGDASVQEGLNKLKSDCAAQCSMDYIAPCVFVGNSGLMGWTHQEALDMMIMLVKSDPSFYLKPASRAVKAMSLQFVATSTEIQVSDNLLSLLVEQMSGQDIEVSSNASDALISCCRHVGSQLSERAIGCIASSLESAWETKLSEKQAGTTACVRLGSALASICCISDLNMIMAMDFGLPFLLLMMNDSTDPLLVMSALEILERISSTFPMHKNRAHWLYSPAVAQPLLVMAGDEEEGPDSLLGGPALRLLSSILKLGRMESSLLESKLVTSFHRVLRKFGELASNEIDRLSLIDAVSSYASASPDALKVVLGDKALLKSWLSLGVAQPKLKSVILHSIAMVIDPPSFRDLQGDIISATCTPTRSLSMKLFAALGECNDFCDASQLVFSLAKSPFVEIRLGTYALLQAVSKSGVGAQLFLTQNGFYEFLVDRNLEPTKEGKEEKIKIVEAILRSDARAVLSDNFVRELEKHLAEGPYYVKSQQWDLATE